MSVTCLRCPHDVLKCQETRLPAERNNPKVDPCEHVADRARHRSGHKGNFCVAPAVVPVVKASRYVVDQDWRTPSWGLRPVLRWGKPVQPRPVPREESDSRWVEPEHVILQYWVSWQSKGVTFNEFTQHLYNPH